MLRRKVVFISIRVRRLLLNEDYLNMKIMNNITMKKKYIKPELEELTDVVNMILAGSKVYGGDPEARQQDNTFAEDDDNYDE